MNQQRLILLREEMILRRILNNKELFVAFSSPYRSDSMYIHHNHLIFSDSIFDGFYNHQDCVELTLDVFRQTAFHPDVYETESGSVLVPKNVLSRWAQLHVGSQIQWKSYGIILFRERNESVYSSMKLYYRVHTDEPFVLYEQRY